MKNNLMNSKLELNFTSPLCFPKGIHFLQRSGERGAGGGQFFLVLLGIGLYSKGQILQGIQAAQVWKSFFLIFTNVHLCFKTYHKH
jgi:hypothetical protein